MRIITGGNDFINGELVPNESNKLIKYMLANKLVRVDARDGGWTILYQDKDNNSYWELTAPQGELQGGGPPQLRELSRQELKDVWGITF